MSEQKRILELLVQLGLTEYQSRVYHSLVTLGPTGVSDIHRHSGVPRTKIYETLEELELLGTTESQPGRPRLYRAIRPEFLVERLTREYESSGREVVRMLKEQDKGARSPTKGLAWTVKGEMPARRKLAETIARATDEIILMETFPPLYILSVKSLLKSAMRKGLVVKVVCLIREDQAPSEYPSSELIEYRTLSLPPPTKRPMKAQEDELLQLLGVAVSMPYTVAIIDGTESYMMIPAPSNPGETVAISARIPGVPAVMRLMYLRLLSLGTFPSKVF